ncbi:zinc ribbon domain-containing protein [Candidatus Pacearchaeota archaeon]|jgi:putative FmdB family regulatory protein|nr:zinc ribbon domain-containing protein [Candidatus Pacearchaeota archaeon]
MPTYEYCCVNHDCNNEWEKESKITEDAEKICPKCGQETAKRLVSGGQGFQLKGSGWFKDGY